MIVRAAAPLPLDEVLARVGRGDRPFVLGAGTDADGLGRYSYASCDPDDELTLPWQQGRAAYDALDAALAREDDDAWWVGYLSYDLGAEAMVRGRAARALSSVDTLGLGGLALARYPALWRFDALKGRAEILARDERSAAKLEARLREGAPIATKLSIAPPRWEISDEEYRRRVTRVIEYLRAGDVYQVNLSHRVRMPLSKQEAPALFNRLHRDAPAPLGVYLATGDAILVGNSPELFLARDGARIETRPIKGTRRRGADADSDRALALALEQSHKDAAEHLMIVDLERNDLGRLAQIGSVAVDGFARRVELPTVHHLVSTVRAELRAEITWPELLAATFPGGSITGAPKGRAVEIIDELEGTRRGVYCGALGIFHGRMHATLSLPIRTAVVKDGELSLSVGGGIVADSTPEDELTETRVKAAAFLRALS